MTMKDTNKLMPGIKVINEKGNLDIGSGCNPEHYVIDIYDKRSIYFRKVFSMSFHAAFLPQYPTPEAKWRNRQNRCD